MNKTISNILENILGNLIFHIVINLLLLLGISTTLFLLMNKVHEVLCNHPQKHIALIGLLIFLIILLMSRSTYIYYSKLKLKKLKIGLLSDKKGNPHCPKCKSLLPVGKEKDKVALSCPEHGIMYGKHPTDGHDMGNKEVTEWINDNFLVNKFERINKKLDKIIIAIKNKPPF